MRYIALDTVGQHIREKRRFSACKDLFLAEDPYTSPEKLLLLRERNDYLWLAYSLLPAHHQVLIGYLVLGRSSYWDVRRVTGLRFKHQMEAELPLSLAIFKAFYQKLYKD